MANTTFKDATGTTVYLSASGAGSVGDPFVVDHTISSITPGTSAAKLGKAEDAAHASGDVGVMALAVRQDTAAALAGTDADYQPLITDSTGRLWCNVSNTVTVASHAVTNAGTFAVQVDGAALTSLQLVDDVIFTDDAAYTPGTSKLAVIGAQADETSADSVDEGDAGALRMTLDRRLRVAQKAVDGPGEPTIDSYTSAAVSASANTADQVLVAAPGANKQIWVYGFAGGADTGAGSFALQDSDDTALSGVVPIAANGQFAVSPSGNFAMPWIKVATNKALEIDTVTCGFKGTISYAVVSV